MVVGVYSGNLTPRAWRRKGVMKGIVLQTKFEHSLLVGTRLYLRGMQRLKKDKKKSRNFSVADVSNAKRGGGIGRSVWNLKST